MPNGHSIALYYSVLKKQQQKNKYTSQALEPKVPQYSKFNEQQIESWIQEP